MVCHTCHSKEHWTADCQDATKDDKVNHPPHYGGKDNIYEAIKVIEAHNLDFCLGNALKYILRGTKKGSEKEDYKKAVWYLQRKIQQMEKGTGK
jgi:hypothetical protein